MKPFFFILMLLIILGINFYVIYRLVYLVPKVLIVRGAVLTITTFAVCCLLSNFIFADKLPLGLSSAIYTIGTSWFFAAIYFLIIFLLLDIARVTGLFSVENILYKNWLSFGAITGLVVIVLFLGNLKYHNKDRVELQIALNKQMGAPLKIVSLSDLHLGYGIGKEEFAKWIELINQENADIVLMSGDVIDNSLRPLRQQGMAEMFKQIKSKYGIYAVPGNHEYFANIMQSEAFFEQADVQLLRDKAVLIDNRFYVIGRDDRTYYGREQELGNLTESLDKSKPLIVLDHQPYELDEVERKKIDLQLSGHTHDGQIWPISWITSAMYEKSHGYLKKGSSHIYVSSGMGIWGGKFRVGTRSEYVVIHLSGRAQ